MTIPKSGNPSVYFNAHDEPHPILRDYLLGLLSARLGYAEAALGHAAKLERFDVPRGAGALSTDPRWVSGPKSSTHVGLPLKRSQRWNRSEWSRSTS